MPADQKPKTVKDPHRFVDFRVVIPAVLANKVRAYRYDNNMPTKNDAMTAILEKFFGVEKKKTEE
jgi:hypothetical protein